LTQGDVRGKKKKILPNIFVINRDPVTIFIKLNNIKEGKAIPLQTWTGPEGSRRLRLPDFKTIGT